MNPIRLSRPIPNIEKKRRRKPKDLEHQEQCALFDWANKSGKPELKLMYAIPNGGERHILVAKKMKAEGVKSGVPDIALPISRGVWHSLYIELKEPKNGTVSDNQSFWIAELNKQNQRAIVCYGWIEAKNAIESYLKNGNC